MSVVIMTTKHNGIRELLTISFDIILAKQTVHPTKLLHNSGSTLIK